MKWDELPPDKKQKISWDELPPEDKSYDWSNAPRDLAKAATEALPIAGGMAGGFIGSVAGPLGTVGGAGLGAGAGKALENIIESNLFDEKKSTGQLLKEPLVEAAYGAAGEGLGPLVAKGIPKAIGALGGAGQYLKTQAGKLATNATGATGAQVSKFADDAGEQLLERGLIKFGDNAENISSRLANELSDTNSIIDSTLKELDAKGVVISQDNIVAELQKKAAALSERASQADVVQKLNKVIDDIINTGKSELPISVAEQEKRDFNRMAGNWLDPEKGQAGKTVYGEYRNAVESAAEAQAPELADKFKKAKETYGLLAPIQEAAERRANTLNQSPFGGLLDVATGTGGAVAGGVPMAAAATVGRRLVSPRISSSAAVTTNKLGDILMKSPFLAEIAKKNEPLMSQLTSRISQKMQSSFLSPEDQQVQTKPNIDKNKIIEKTQGSKYAQVLQNAANVSDQKFNAAHFVLSQNNQDYRQMLEDEEQ